MLKIVMPMVKLVMRKEKVAFIFNRFASNQIQNVFSDWLGMVGKQMSGWLRIALI